MNEIIEKLSSLLENLPGVGPRQAKRFVYHLVDEDDKYIEEIVVLLGKIKNIGRCELCFQPEQRYAKCVSGRCTAVLHRQFPRRNSVRGLHERDRDSFRDGQGYFRDHRRPGSR